MYDEKGRLRSVDVFKNGAYISYEWYLTSGQREQLFDYTRHLEGQEHSWYMAEYNKKGELKFEGYFGKAQYGWKIYEIKTQNDVSTR